MGQKQHGNEKTRNHPGAALDPFEAAAEDADDNVRNQAECNAVGDVVRKRHHDQCQESGDGGFEVVPVYVFYASHHKKANVDQGSGGGTAGNQLCDGA